MKKLTDHFYLEEFTNSATATMYRINNVPSRAEEEWIKFGAIYVLEPLRFQANYPITITSGFRCRQLNVRVHGVVNSQHLIGQAADIRILDEKQALLFFNILKKNKWVDQLLVEHSQSARWLHVSWSAAPRHYYNFNYCVS